MLEVAEPYGIQLMEVQPGRLVQLESTDFHYLLQIPQRDGFLDLVEKY